jgi:hypothetical protein
VIIADTRSARIVADAAASLACVFDFDVDVYSDFCPRSEQLSGGVASTPFNSARQRLEVAH